MNPGTCNFHTTIYVYPHLHLRHPLHPLNTKIFRTPSPIGHYNRDLLRTNRRWFYFKVLDKNDVDKTRLKHADFPFHSILFYSDCLTIYRSVCCHSCRGRHTAPALLSYTVTSSRCTERSRGHFPKLLSLSTCLSQLTFHVVILPSPCCYAFLVTSVNLSRLFFSALNTLGDV